MSKLNVKFTNGEMPARGTRGSEVQVGTVFFGSIRNPSVYLRIFDGIVDLRDPQQTWSFEGKQGPKIDDYRPAESAQLVVE